MDAAPDLALGTHLLIELTGAHGLDEPARLEAAFRDCVAACGATLLHLHVHRFAPQGLTGVAMLAESHICAHTWPELGYGAFDVFMCGACDPRRAIPVLQAAFAPTALSVTERRRGPGC